MSKQMFDRYSEYEDTLRVAFHEHPIYAELPRFTREQFIEYLLQVGFIADNFVKWYQTAMHGLTLESAREVIRAILRDEIPGDMPTHQEERMHDLLMMGASRQRVLHVRPTVDTRNAINRLYELVEFPQDRYDLRTLIVLRMADEVLVAEQYRHIVRFMKTNLGIAPEESRFFVPHYLHDLKGKEAEEGGHTDAFDAVLAEMIETEEDLKIACDTARRAYEARSAIQDQFVSSHSMKVRAARAIGETMAALMILTAGLVIQMATKTADHESWQQFLAANPQAAAFYLDCDRRVIARAAHTSDMSDLKKVGTFASCEAEWGVMP